MKLNQEIIDKITNKSLLEICDENKEFVINTLVEFKQKVPNLYELNEMELKKLLKYCNELWEEKQWDLK